MVCQFPQFDSHAVFHRRVIEVDLKPVPDDDRTPRQGENVLHDASSGFRRDRIGGFAERRSGKLNDQFVVDIVQGGSGPAS